MSEINILYKPNQDLKGHQQLVVAEIQPFQTLVFSKQECFEVWYPWMVYAINPLTFHSHIWVRPAPLQAVDQMLYIMPFPHTDASGSICYFPAQWVNLDLKKAAQAGERLEEFVAACLTAYTSGDNKYFLSTNGIPPEIAQQVRHRHDVKEFLGAWEKLTKEQVLELHFHPLYPLSEAVDRLIGRTMEDTMRHARIFHHESD